MASYLISFCCLITFHRPDVPTGGHAGRFHIWTIRIKRVQHPRAGFCVDTSFHFNFDKYLRVQLPDSTVRITLVLQETVKLLVSSLKTQDRQTFYCLSRKLYSFIFYTLVYKPSQLIIVRSEEPVSSLLSRRELSAVPGPSVEKALP